MYRELRFGAVEAGAFLTEVMGLHLLPQDLTTLQTLHGGLGCWPATGRAFLEGED